ncbi:MAG: hypothetical protein JWL59_2262 [Chthoniobacteraceae bacterium]|nr:hypothetical protein [Chthoniobacteraceae bacterium]
MNPSPTFAGRHAFRLAVALLAGLACVAAFSAVSRSNVAALEQFEETTAFGDTHYFVAPADSHAAVVNLDGMPLFLAGDEKLERRDTRMARLGRDEATGLAIYTPREATDGKEKVKGKPGWFLKLGPDEYLRLRPGKG